MQFGAVPFGSVPFGAGAAESRVQVAGVIRYAVPGWPSLQRAFAHAIVEADEFCRLVARQLAPPAQRAAVRKTDALQLEAADELRAPTARAVFAARLRAAANDEPLPQLAHAHPVRARRGLPSREVLAHFLREIA
jgi:hypothetical protein